MLPDDVVGMRRHAEKIFFAGLEAVQPEAVIHRHCQRVDSFLNVREIQYDLSRFRHVFVLGAGKAGALMAKALEELLGEYLTGGWVNVKYGHQAELDRVIVNEAGHPYPDAAGMRGAGRIMQMAREAGKDDLIICVISGGGSALLPIPAEGISLAEKQETTRILTERGAVIHELNSVRKHISQIKGGRLAQAVYPASLLTLVLSDVVGDDLDVIASGPTVPDTSTFQDCLQILDRYHCRGDLPSGIIRHLEGGACGKAAETARRDDPAFHRSRSMIVGNNQLCLRKAAEAAESLGYRALILSSRVEGETREVAKVHAAIAKDIRTTGIPLPSPACVLSGGETTVTYTGSGKGGRNQEFSLSLALELQGWAGIVGLSAGTDGTDGPTDAAGAFADGSTVSRALSNGLDARSYLERHDSYPFFKRLDDLLITGPTKTNVMDLRILLIETKEVTPIRTKKRFRASG